MYSVPKRIAYSSLMCDVEQEILPYCERSNIGVIAYRCCNPAF
jgi:hypothetical protein